MRSSFCRESPSIVGKRGAGPMLQNSEMLSFLDDHIGKRISQSVCDISTHCIRAAGVLRYKRESDDDRLDLTDILPEDQPSECPIKCEYCGGKARPSLDLAWVEEFEAVPVFCCAQRQHLCKILLRERRLGSGSLKSEEEKKRITELEEFLLRGREMEDHKFIMDLPHGLGEKELNEDYAVRLPESCDPGSKVLSFRLSCSSRKGFWPLYPWSKCEDAWKIKKDDIHALIPVCDLIPVQFGICHHQDGGGFLQKYYSNGIKFLTLFSDDSAQVFYPSGLLAILIVITKQNGRVCIVYDDSDAPSQQVRAVFQSDGRATCYYGNGNIWLTLDKIGGQCLDEVGTRVRRWSWKGPIPPPTPLLPIFLSFNKYIGVRILGKEQVFVSFLACGQQAKFSVGCCCSQCKCTTEGPTSGPSISKEEIFILAARIKINS